MVKGLPGTLSAYAERVMGGSYLDFEIDRDAAARYGLTVGDVQDVIQSAIGGMNVSWTVEGLERYPINVRYPRELRDDAERLEEILVATPAGLQVPLGQLATIDIHQGPPGIKSRERPAQRLGLRRPQGDRRRHLGGARPQGGGEKVRCPPATPCSGRASTSTCSGPSSGCSSSSRSPCS